MNQFRYVKPLLIVAGLGCSAGAFAGELLSPPEAAPAIAEPPRASAVIDAATSAMFLALSVMVFLSLGMDGTSPGDQGNVRRA